MIEHYSIYGTIEALSHKTDLYRQDNLHGQES